MSNARVCIEEVPIETKQDNIFYKNYYKKTKLKARLLIRLLIFESPFFLYEKKDFNKILDHIQNWWDLELNNFLESKFDKRKLNKLYRIASWEKKNKFRYTEEERKKIEIEDGKFFNRIKNIFNRD